MFIAISQDNIDLGVKGYADSLENNYFNYFKEFGINLIPISNGSDVKEYFDNISIKAIILTGGTDIGKREIRDQTEEKLLKTAIEKNLLVLGICRGIQFINHYFGGSSIKSIKEEIKNNVGHIATVHKINLLEEVKVVDQNIKILEDGAITPGGCVIETDFGSVDCQIETRWEETRKALGGNKNESTVH